MTNTCKFGEIFISRFPFTSGEFSKPRPVLVLFDCEQDVLICRVTSVAYSGKLDIEIKQWKEGGLEKPSFVRLNRLVTAEKSLLTKKLGMLTPADAATVKAIWNQQMRL